MEETAEQPKPEIKNITAAVSLEDHARIRALCQKHDTTAQAIVEYCLRLGLDRLEEFNYHRGGASEAQAAPVGESENRWSLTNSRYANGFAPRIWNKP